MWIKCISKWVKVHKPRAKSQINWESRRRKQSSGHHSLKENNATNNNPFIDEQSKVLLIKSSKIKREQGYDKVGTQSREIRLWKWFIGKQKQIKSRQEKSNKAKESQGRSITKLGKG